jgi:transposase
LNAAVLRHAGVALDEAVLHFDLAAHCINQAAELDDAAAPVCLTMPPYSPDPNPIEQACAKIKHWMRTDQNRTRILASTDVSGSHWCRLRMN